ncbi:major facilitator superfamily domain-containing protein 6-A [Hydra vulgaris]|uniref:major facilitator superfamily domain-containing protein 6-A n=1 Tax=Hydra vulgaris TaxID=6087 RepID=UPI0001926AB1|nr:major facilitator superfamily domain-containing protein 6-A [Hydra vulgaris]
MTGEKKSDGGDAGGNARTDVEKPSQVNKPVEDEEEDDSLRLKTTEDRRAEGLCCPRVNRQLLTSKAFYFCFFSAWGSLLPYLALYFKQLMLTPSQVGIIMGLKPFVNFLATPVWGALTDKFHIHKIVLIVSMTALITSTFSLSLVPGPKQQATIIKNHCNRTEDMSEMMALDGEQEIGKMVVLEKETSDFYFSKERWPWPVDFIASFEQDFYNRYKIDASKTFTSLFLITLFGTVIASPSLALVDTATLQMLGKETHRYGKQRLTGSLGWGLGAFIVGASLKTTHHCSISKSREIVDYIPCFYVFAVLMTLGLVVAFKFKFSSSQKAGQTRSLSVGLVALKDPTYLMFLFTALYLGFLMAFIKTFLFWHLKDLGGTQLLFSVISAVNCVAEVSMYFLSEKLISKIGQIRVLYLGLICYSIRLFYYSILPYTWLVLVVELLPGITTAAVWAACLSYVSINSRPGAQTTMQCILHGVHWGLGYGAGEVIGGILVHHYGAPTTFVMFGILCIVVLLLYILINMIWGEKDRKRRQDDETQTEGFTMFTNDDDATEELDESINGVSDEGLKTKTENDHQVNKPGATQFKGEKKESSSLEKNVPTNSPTYTNVSSSTKSEEPNNQFDFSLVTTDQNHQLQNSSPMTVKSNMKQDSSKQNSPMYLTPITSPSMPVKTNHNEHEKAQLISNDKVETKIDTIETKEAIKKKIDN